MGVLLPAVLLCGVNSLAGYLCRARFGEVLPLTLAGSALVVYLGQMGFQTFSAGLLALSVCGAAGYVLLVWKRRAADFFSPGFVAFIVVCVCMAVYDFHRHLTDFDEFWHWGMMIKESLRLDRFYCVPESRMVIHKDYPPFPMLAELIWCKAAGGGYSETTATMGLHVFSLSPLVCLLTERVAAGRAGGDSDLRVCEVAREVVVSFLLLAIGVMTVNALDSYHDFNTLLADVPLGMVFGLSLFLAVDDGAHTTRLGFANLLLSLAVLVMIKQAGIAYMLIAVFLYFLVEMAGQRARKAGGVGKSVALAAIPLALLLSWNQYVRGMGINDLRAAGSGQGQFDLSKIDLGAYLDVFRGGSSDLPSQTVKNFFRALFAREIGAVAWFPLTVASTLLIVLLLAYLGYRLAPRALSRHKATCVAIAFVLGTLAYCVMLSILFMFCFTDDEMEELRGYERYFDSLFIGMVLCLLMVVAPSVLASESGRGTVRRLSVATTCCAVLLCSTTLGYLMPQALRADDYKAYRQMAEYVEARADVGTTIAFMTDDADSNWYGFTQSCVYYYLNEYDVVTGMDLYSADYTDAATASSAVDELESCDYLYVEAVSDSANAFLSAYDGGQALQGGALYRINHEDGITLERVG